METVIVGGPHSYVGKTLAAEIAVRTLLPRKVGAIKLTVADGERDPSHDHTGFVFGVADAAGICGRGASCGVCETVTANVPSRTITTPGAIQKAGTDTRRLSDAGALAVVWIIALRSAAPRAVEMALAHLEAQGAEMTVIEGTTALEWLSPLASVLVATDPGRQWKRVALEHVRSADIVLRNLVTPSGDIPAPAEFLDARPLVCDLARTDDIGTKTYVERLRSLIAARIAPAV